jgi:CrcB protein
MAGEPSPLFATLTVAAGGAVGAALRYQTGRAVTTLAGPGVVFPWPTLIVNVLGSLAMGILVGWLVWSGQEENYFLRLLIGTGLLGGFTTFSAFSLDTAELLQRGEVASALTYITASVIAGLGALMIGLIAMRGSL